MSPLSAKSLSDCWRGRRVVDEVLRELNACGRIEAGEALLALKVGVFRPAEASARTLLALQALGFAGAAAPISALVALDATPPPRDFGFVVAASAAAFLSPPREVFGRSAQLPLWLVGPKTGEAAREIGLSGDATVFATAADLVAALDAAPPGEALILAGRSRNPAIEQGFSAAGRPFALCEVYDAVARTSWSEREIEGLRGCDAFLHYSRRSAELAKSLAETSGLQPTLAAGLHACLSSDIAQALASAGYSRIVTASAPNEAALFDVLISAKERL